MTATLLANGKTQFIDNNGAPLVNGTVGFYVQATLTPKSTWQDSGQTILNTNPITLDSRGQAIIWGSGVYRQIVQDALGNVIWDQLTASNFSGTFGSQQTVASNTTTDIGAASSNNILVTGTTTITSLGTSASLSNPLYVVQFQSAGLTLTYNGTSLILPGGVNVVTQANDWAIFEVINAGLGYWQCVSYQRANGQTLSMAGQETAIASNTTTDIGSTGSNLVKINGVTTITSLGSSASTASPLYFVKFASALTLTYNSSSLKLPTSANITTAANDYAVFEYLGSGNWICLDYQPSSGVPLTTPSGLLIKVDTYTTHGTSTWTRPAGCSSIVVEVVGAGGGGASSQATAGNHSNGGGGGGAGGYTKGRVLSPASTYTVTVAQGGPGGSSGGLNSGGNASGSTSFGSILVCAGGLGGAAGADVTNASRGVGGAGGAVSTPGNITSIAGQAGSDGSGAPGIGGMGGSTPLGFGGSATASGQGNGISGNNGTGNGSGGSGSAAFDAGSNETAAGGNGADGAVIVYSYS